MVEPPLEGLPQTNGPFELLGIAPDANLKDVRRAYARLIKVYRPEQAPSEFQRIHAAFEFLTAELAAPTGQRPPLAPAPLPQRVDPRPVLGSPEELQRVVELSPGADPRAVELARLVRLFQQSLRDGVAPIDSARLWLQAFDAELDFVPHLFALSPEPVLDSVARDSRLGWQRLSQSRLDQRAALWRLHAERLLFEGRFQAVLAELRSPGFADATQDDPELMAAALSTMSAIGWDVDEGSLQDLAWLFGSEVRSPALQYFDDACKLREKLRLLEETSSIPRAFFRFMRLARVSPSLHERIWREMRQSFYGDPEPWWRFCRLLTVANKDVADYFREMLAHDGAFPQPSFAELPEAKQTAIVRLLEDVRALETGRFWWFQLLHNLTTILFALAIAVAVLALLWGWFTATGSAVAFGIKTFVFAMLMWAAAYACHRSAGPHRALLELRARALQMGLSHAQLATAVLSVKHARPYNIPTMHELDTFLAIGLAIGNVLRHDQAR
ncbi:MAG TPA: J domain-containing protein [Polyangiaceae bacterium]|nr:J domain-containing protein [Polyangiaceae bacterium]